MSTNPSDLGLQDAGKKLTEFLDPIRELGKMSAEWFQQQQSNLILFLMILTATFVITAIVSWLITHIVLKLARKTKNELDDKLIDAVNRPMVFLLLVSGTVCGVGVLKMPPSMLLVIHKIYYSIATLLVVWGILRVVEVFNVYFKAIAGRNACNFDNLLIDLLRRVIKVSLWIIALLFIAQNIFSLNVSAMLAGAGVAGLAIAFAAQNTVANIFGAITLILDKPFKTGERIIVGDKDGIVEGIGLRSSKIRALDGTLWTIPNREMADGSIRNLTRRPNFKHSFEIGLVYNTPEEKMRRAVELLHEILDGKSGFDMENLPPRIFFSDFKDWSLNITVIVWFQTVDYFEMMAEREKMNMEILRRFNAEGLEFAFPTHTACLVGDKSNPLRIEEIKVAERR